MQEKLASMSPEEIKELQKRQCPFCQIIAGKIPAKKIYEDDKVIALLDINPAVSGHTLLMPKEHYTIMPFVPDDVLVHLAKISKALSKAFLRCLFAKGTTIFIANGAAAGQQVQHFLIHLVPREEGDGLDVFTLPETQHSPEMERAFSALSQQFYAAMRDYCNKYPSGKTLPPQEKISEDQLSKLVEQNPQLRELILKQPAQFKQLATTHPQLKPLFSGVDIDAFIANYVPALSKEVEKDKEEDKNNGPEKVDLDQISSLINKEHPLPTQIGEAEAKTPETKEKPAEKKAPLKKKSDDVDLDKVLDLLGGNA